MSVFFVHQVRCETNFGVQIKWQVADTQKKTLLREPLCTYAYTNTRSRAPFSLSFSCYSLCLCFSMFMAYIFYIHTQTLLMPSCLRALTQQNQRNVPPVLSEWIYHIRTIRNVLDNGRNRQHYRFAKQATHIRMHTTPHQTHSERKRASERATECELLSPSSPVLDVSLFHSTLTAKKCCKRKRFLLEEYNFHLVFGQSFCHTAPSSLPPSQTHQKKVFHMYIITTQIIHIRCNPSTYPFKCWFGCSFRSFVLFVPFVRFVCSFHYNFDFNVFHVAFSTNFPSIDIDHAHSKHKMRK